MIPIPGTKRVRYLEDNMGAFALNLTPDDLKETDERIRGIRVAGGWVWKRLARPLREEGHDVYTPTVDQYSRYCQFSPEFMTQPTWERLQ
jgi:hypothetical protein